MFYGPLRSFNDPLSTRDESPELDFGPAAKAFLPGAVCHVERKAERVQPGVHRLMKDRRRHLRIGEIVIDGERQLDQTRSLFVKVRPSTGEALHHYQRKIALEMTEVVRRVLFD